MNLSVKTLRSPNFGDSNNFNQPDSNISVWLIKLEAVVLVVRSSDWFTTRTYDDNFSNWNL